MKVFFRASSIFTLSGLLVSCAGTQYGAGNIIREFDEKPGVMLSVFNGNSATESNAASDYSVLAALEHCAQKSQYTLMVSPIDLSVSSTSINTSVNTYQANGVLYTNYNSYPVTTRYPRFTTIFRCTNKVRILEEFSSSEHVSREMVHAITKDFKAGEMIKALKPNVKRGALQVDDIIIKVDNVRTEDLDSMWEVLEKTDKSMVPVTIIRNSKVMTVSAPVFDNTSSITLMNAEAARRICSTRFKPVSKPKPSPSAPKSADSKIVSSQVSKVSIDRLKEACETTAKFFQN